MLILLDIDGVMVTTPSWKQPIMLDDNFPDFNKESVKNLNDILNQTKSTVVLTTSHKSKYTLDEWSLIFSKRGIECNLQKLNNQPSTNRYDEIIDWFETYGENNFVIIDDDKQLNKLPNNIKCKLVSTDLMIGLNSEVKETVINILKKLK